MAASGPAVLAPIGGTRTRRRTSRPDRAAVGGHPRVPSAASSASAFEVVRVTGARRGPSLGRGWRIVFAGAIASGLVAIVGLWVAHGGVESLRTIAGATTSVGRLTGLLSAFGFLLSLFMMARVRVLERAVGQDRLVRHHRFVGGGALALLVLHVALVSEGYALSSGLGLIAQLVDLVLHYSDVLGAAIAIGLLGLVLVTSLPPIRRLMRYEVWHLTHLYAYLGIGLSVPHETSIGTELSGMVRYGWWVLWAAATSAVVIWRLARPLWISWRHQLVVDRVVPESPDTVSVYVRGVDLSALEAAPGQFFVWRFLGGRGWSRGHPYSLSAAPTDRTLRITVRRAGDGSGAAARLRGGTRVLVEGPYGRMHPGVHPGGPAVLIASGVGITPIRAMLERLASRPGELTLIYRATSPDRLVLAQEIEAFAAAQGVSLIYVLGPRRTTRGASSWVPASAGELSDGDALRTLVPGISDQHVFICGPPAWSGAVRRAARDAGVASGRIHDEFVDW
jgi:ferredoxin-NADP reductase